MAKAYGMNNQIIVPLGYVGTVTGNGSSRSLTCIPFNLPVKSMLVGIYAACTSCATGGTSTLNVLADGSKVTTSGVALSSGTTSGSNETILGAYTKHNAGTIFTLCENTTNSVEIVNPGVVLMFRTMKA